jgi:signal transduction histidine kinase
MKRTIVLFLAGTLMKDLTGQIPLNGLGIWLKTGTAVKTQGTDVILWDDESGNHHNAFSILNDSYDPPQLVSNALNNFPVVHFNGSNNGMETPAFATFPKKRGTIIIVAKINGRSATSGVGLGNLVCTYHGKGVVWQFGASPDKYAYYDGVGGEGFPVQSAPPSEWGIITLIRDNDTIMNFYRNGRYETAFPVHDNQPDSNSLKIGFNGRLGTNIDSIPEILNGDIAEIIIYDRNLESEELSSVHKYLSEKYKLALAPPSFWLRWWFISLVALFLLTIVFSIIQYIDRRKLRKKLAELEKQREIDRERQRISREMHDDIGAGLTQIILMIESAKAKSTNGNEKELVDVANTSRTLVANLSEIIWSLNPENKSLDQLCAYLREQLNKQLEYAGIEYSIQLPEDRTDIILSNEQRRNILLVTKEIVNNAIKYSKAKNISIKAELINEGLAFIVQDDGSGFDTAKSYPGNGLKNIRSRIAEMGGNLQISSFEGTGSKFEYFISLKKA